MHAPLLTDPFPAGSHVDLERETTTEHCREFTSLCVGRTHCLGLIGSARLPCGPSRERPSPKQRTALPSPSRSSAPLAQRTRSRTEFRTPHQDQDQQHNGLCSRPHGWPEVALRPLSARTIGISCLGANGAGLPELRIESVLCPPGASGSQRSGAKASKTVLRPYVPTTEPFTVRQ